MSQGRDERQAVAAQGQEGERGEREGAEDRKQEAESKLVSSRLRVRARFLPRRRYR